MHLAHFLRSSKQSYMQFLPVLTAVWAWTCTTWRFVYVLIARLRCWLYLHIQFCLNFYTSAGYHCKISLIITGWRAMRAVHFCGLESCVPLSASIVRDMNREWVIDAHSQQCVAFNSCRQIKLWIKYPKLQATKYFMSLPKKQFRILVSLITGHCCLNKHIHRMELTASPLCGSCQLQEETALHFVCVCSTLSILRTSILGKPIMNALEFVDVLASAILQFAFQSGRLETNLWHNSLQYVRWLFNVGSMYQ
jgi:hypothetical protein